MKKYLMMACVAMLCMGLGSCERDDNNDSELNGNGRTVPPPVDWVDLDLPSGLLWASCNVGASSPEEYGDYFAWGETRPKGVYSWSNYRYANGNYDQLTKYCSYSPCGYNGFTDNLIYLLPEDDAATANWGAGVRTPTEADWSELISNTEGTWFQLNGVWGRRFIGSNGSTLFLPAAGEREDREIYSEGEMGLYWTACLGESDRPQGAGSYGFRSDNQFLDGDSRCCGLPVRAVLSVR